MSATCLELNNNCEYRESTISKEKITDGDRLLEQSNVTNLLTTVEVKQKYDRSKPPSSYNCQHCSKTFRYSSRLKRHLTTHQKKQYPCRICHKLFSRVDVMEVHIARTHLKNVHTTTEGSIMSDVTTSGSTSSGSVSSPSSSPSSSCDEESVAGKKIHEPYSSRVDVLQCITGSFDPSPR